MSVHRWHTRIRVRRRLSCILIIRDFTCNGIMHSRARGSSMCIVRICRIRARIMVGIRIVHSLHVSRRYSIHTIQVDVLMISTVSVRSMCSFILTIRLIFSRDICVGIRNRTRHHVCARRCTRVACASVFIFD